MNDGGITADLAVRSPQGDAGGHVLVGKSLLFQQVLSVVDAVARNDCAVLLEGESGTGKELVARRIHQLSHRAQGPFIPVNCPGIGESLFESQFYGHVKGAFTGATTDTLGVVRAAQGGTLLLDEVGELDLHLQPKLLRLLQEREVTPVGASKPIPVDTRIIASTNRSLAKCVSEGLFRNDLYHRLNVVRIEIPPLRNRPEDIEQLLDYYLQYFSDRYKMPKREFGHRLRHMLTEYPWRGNVRELAGYVERLYAANLPPMPPSMSLWDDGYSSTPADSVLLPPDRMAFTDFSNLGHSQGRPPAEIDAQKSAPMTFSLAKLEAGAIRKVLELTGGNRAAAARILEIHRSTLLRKMRSMGMNDPE